MLLTLNGTADELGVRSLEHHFENGAGGAQFAADAVDASWEITEAVPGGSDLTVTVQWVAADELSFNRNDCANGFWDGTKWDYGSAPGSAATGSDPFTQNRMGIGLGVIGVRSGSALPVELIDFQAVREGNMTRLIWQTASEINADRFEVEHSADGVFFEKIGALQAEGGLGLHRDYAFVHERPIPGVNYYRLRMIDLDGSFEFSKIRTLEFDDLGSLAGIAVYPNPTAGLLYFSLPTEGEFSVELSNAIGQKLATERVVTNQSPTSLDLRNLSRGGYFLKITAVISGKSSIQKIMLE